MDTMGNLRRTHYALETLDAKIGDTVVVAGFIARSRNLGTLVFADLRDRTGIVQLAFDDSSDAALVEKAKTLKSESTVMAQGVIRERSSKNKEIPTGDIEIFVTDLRILNIAETPPFEIREEVSVRDDLALQYRYLQLRLPSLTEAIVMRHKIVKCARDYFDEQKFVEIETPMLIKSTPEGARDYLVPSRVQPGHFYALPQSPQIYKQLLMIAGFDRYMQIARCFRDEDLRADRQPEFTQIDFEVSFADVDDIIELQEGFLKRLFKEILNKDITTPLRRIKYDEAMSRYGSDKPDTRFGLELVDISDKAASSGFGVFAGAVENGGRVCAINAKGLNDKISRKEIDRLTDFVKTYRAGGLAYARVTDDGINASFSKFVAPELLADMLKDADAQSGDIIFIVADRKKDTVYTSLGALRCEIAAKYGLIDPERFDLLWVTDFPLFEYNEEENRYEAKHHPFTAPRDEDYDKLETDQGNCYAKAYDIVINGTEAGGGSVRISNPQLQKRMFRALGFSDERAQQQFGFLINAYRYGAPPHAGLAYGLDRLVMLLLKKPSIRDVIAFPKVQNAGEPMSGAPDVVDIKQLEDLSIKLDLKK